MAPLRHFRGMDAEEGDMRKLQGSAVLLLVVLLAGCGGSSAPESSTTQPTAGPTAGDVPTWTLPSDPMTLAREA